MLSSLLLCNCFVALLTIGSANVIPYRNAVAIQQQAEYNTFATLLALLLNSEQSPAESQYQQRYNQPGERLLQHHLLNLVVISLKSLK